jgi:OmpA-OmpF porin, OOP family
MRRALAAAAFAGAVVTGVFASGARAQDTPILGPGQWYVSPLLSGIIDDEDRLTDDGWGAGLGFGKHFLPHWNAELDFLYNRFDGYNRVDQSGAGLDFIGMGNISNRVVPYGVIGLDYLRTNVVEAPGGPRGRDDDNMATSFGIGVMARLGHSRALFRIEARERYEFAEPDNLMDLFFSAGFVFPIGQQPVAPPEPAAEPAPPPAAPPPPPPADSDGDGVTDDKDQCPGTPPGVKVDYRGCEIKKEIELRDVNFEFDSAKLTADSSTPLDGAVSTLNRYPELTVECTGHTDWIGTDAYNQSLSERRAHSVCTYLIEHGIDKARLTEHGYGESQPIADNHTDEGRAMNRRVTLRVTGGN